MLRNRTIVFASFLGIVMSLAVIFHLLYSFKEEASQEAVYEEALNFKVATMIKMMRDNESYSLPFSEEEEEWMSNLTEGAGFHFHYRDLKGDSWENGFNVEARKTVEMPVVARGKLHGHVIVSYTNNESFVVKSANPKRLADYDVIMIVLLFIGICYVAARKLTEHTAQLSKSALRIQQGRRIPDLPLFGPKELRQVSQTVNDLISDLNRQESMRKDLMQDLAHELRTPLTSMLITIEAIIDGVYAANEEQLQEIYEEIERLSRLVKDMEQLSEAEGSRFSLKIKNHDMSKLLKGVYQNFIPIAKEKGIRLNYQQSHIPCYSEVDNDRVIQMVYNLLSNAIKYTDEDGTVILGLDCTEHDAIIYCQDSGIGIESSQLPLIFNRLYRVDKSRSRVSGGLGVGLSITKALVEAHQGEIIAESAPGKGSKFTIVLPKKYKGIVEP
ncbi:sensor histidine kinase [Paenibacillus tarimensis]